MREDGEAAHACIMLVGVLRHIPGMREDGMAAHAGIMQDGVATHPWYEGGW